MEYQVGSLADIISGSSGKKKSKQRTGMPKVKFEKVAAKEVPITKSISKKKMKSEDGEPSKKRVRISEPADVDSPVKKGKNTSKANKQDPQFIEEQKRTIFVGNIIKTSTKDDMRRIFSQYGYIEAIRFRSVSVADPRTTKKVAVIKKKLHPDRSNMNAYIRFRDIESAQKALVENGTVVNEHTLRVDMALRDDHYNSKACIFVGNLKFSIEEENLRKAFQDCGKILNVRIVRDKETGMGKGIAFIEFENSQSVELALKLNEEDLMGRAMRVSRLRGKNKSLVKGRRQSQAMKGKKLKANSPQVHDSEVNGNTSNVGKNKKASAKQHGTNQKNKAIVSEFQGEKTDQKKAKKKKKQNKGELNKKIMKSKLGIIPKSKQTKPAKKM